MRLELRLNRRDQHIAFYQNPREERTAAGCRILAAEKAAYLAYPFIVHSITAGTALYFTLQTNNNTSRGMKVK